MQKTDSDMDDFINIKHLDISLGQCYIYKPFINSSYLEIKISTALLMLRKLFFKVV